jgi:hypothetical protein
MPYICLLAGFGLQMAWDYFKGWRRKKRNDFLGSTSPQGLHQANPNLSSDNLLAESTKPLLVASS